MHRQPLYILSLLVFLATGPKAQESPIVDYTTSAIPMEQAVAAISKQVGKRLTVGNDLAGEPIVLRLKDVPLEEAMAKLAEVIGAEWVPIRDGQMLTRTPAVIARLQAQDQARLAAAIRKDLERMVAARKGQPQLDAAEAKKIAERYVNMLVAEKQRLPSGGSSLRRDLSDRTADGRLMTDILVAIGPERLAGLGRGRPVFAIDPTPAQRPIEGLGEERVQQYIAERNLLADALELAMKPVLHDGLRGPSIQAAAAPIKDTTVRVLIEFQPAPQQSQLWGYLKVYDSKGHALAESQLSMNRLGYDEWLRERTRVRVASIKEPSIKIDPFLVEIAKRAEDVPSAPSPRQLDPKALEYLLRPDLHDPLNLAFSQIVLSVGERENRNVIATMADQGIYTAVRACEAGEVKAPVFEMLISRWMGGSFQRPDGWYIAAPKSVLEASLDRGDRSALARFMQATFNQGFTKLEDWAALAVASEGDGAQHFAYAYRNLLRAQNAMYDWADWNGYRLFGLLSPEQELSLAGGGTLPYRALTREQQSCLSKMLYEETSSLVTDGKLTPGQLPSIDFYTNDERVLEPTESVPNGIPEDAVLSAKEEVKDIFYAVVADHIGSSTHNEKDRPMDMGWVASTLATWQRPDLFDQAHSEEIKSLRYGHRRTLRFTLGLGTSMRLISPLTEEQKPEGPSVTPSELKDYLPPDVWERLDAQIQRQLAEYKKGEKEIRSRPKSNDGVPPPPPR
ncbi:MAG: hypothetical protein QOJ65_1965 [Fimbriimonadaceae bacterium]|nr:hypothetical protein [Fimbriimonadaceae bacterium]